MRSTLSVVMENRRGLSGKPKCCRMSGGGFLEGGEEEPWGVQAEGGEHRV